MLDRSGHIVGIDLNDIISALSLGLEDLKCLGLVSGSDDTVGHFSLNELCRSYVANVGKCYPVAKGAHSVSASCSRVSAGKGRVVKALDIVNEASLFKLFGKDSTNSRACRAYVLEGGNCGETCCLLELFYELPGVKCVKEVNISGTSAKDLDGKVASVCHKDLRGLLIRVTTVFKFKFFHFSTP